MDYPKGSAGLWLVEPDWQGETAVILGSGPSVIAAMPEISAARDRARVIAVNDAWKLSPWAELLWATDYRWWHWHRGVPEFAGVKASREDSRTAAAYVDVRLLRQSFDDKNDRGGFDPEPSRLRLGGCGGFAAVGLAAKLGARRIVLAGFDMRAIDGRTHWFGDHVGRRTTKDDFEAWRRWFPTLVEPMKTLGIEVINATPGSALGCFPIATIEKALG